MSNTQWLDVLKYVLGSLATIAAILFQQGRWQGRVDAKLDAHCRDIGLLLAERGIPVPAAPGRDRLNDVAAR